MTAVSGRLRRLATGRSPLHRFWKPNRRNIGDLCASNTRNPENQALFCRTWVKRDNFRKFPEKNKNHIFPKIELKNAIKCEKMKKNLKIIKK
jgi:hypothetical protein